MGLSLHRNVRKVSPQCRRKLLRDRPRNQKIQQRDVVVIQRCCKGITEWWCAEDGNGPRRERCWMLWWLQCNVNMVLVFKSQGSSNAYQPFGVRCIWNGGYLGVASQLSQEGGDGVLAQVMVNKSRSSTDVHGEQCGMVCHFVSRNRSRDGWA